MDGEYRVYPVIVVLDEIQHNDAHPFCSDPDCPCHNQDAYEEHLEPGLNDGSLTGAEALRLYWDQR